MLVTTVTKASFRRKSLFWFMDPEDKSHDGREIMAVGIVASVVRELISLNKSIKQRELTVNSLSL